MSTDHIKKAIRAGWDAMSDAYQRQSRIALDDVHYAPFAPGERELRLLGPVSGKRVLELACGAAQNSIALSRWGADVVALDISSVQLGHASELKRREADKVELVRGDLDGFGEELKKSEYAPAWAYGFDDKPEDKGLVFLIRGLFLAKFGRLVEDKEVLLV